MTLRRLRSAAKLLERDEARRIAVNAEGAVPMDDHPHATDNALDQTEQELLVSTVSDEALEKAACGTSWAQTYPQTCVATICVGDALLPKKLSGQTPNAR
jgi:fructose-1-phosphate kinase PfkB-like protein